MPTFILLTRVSPEALRSTHAVETLERQAMLGPHTEIWAATEWPRFKEIVRSLPELAGLAVVSV